MLAIALWFFLGCVVGACIALGVALYVLLDTLDGMLTGKQRK